MEDPCLTALREMIVKALNECMDPELLDLIFKMLCFH